MSGQSDDFAGRTVLVTGGARGVGRAITTAFAIRGAHVIVNYFHATQEAPQLVDEVTARGGSVELFRASVADLKQVDAMFDEVTNRHGGLDVLVNNSASGALLPLSQLHESHWQRALDTNVRGSLWCARRAAPLMATRGGGAIVNLSSIGSSLVISDYATVGTSKAAVEALTRYLAVEFAADGIRVNTASGGPLDGMVATLFPDAERLAERVRQATPLDHRLGREEELAELVVFLASPAASWITGQTVVADGGLSLGAATFAPVPRVDAEPGNGRGGTNGTNGTGNGRTAPARPPAAVTTPGDAAVAVVGVGVVTPGANDPEELWQVLAAGRNVFGRPRLFEVESFYSADPAAADRTYTRESGFITDFRPHPALGAELADGTVPSHESTTLWLRHCLHTALERVRRRTGDRYTAVFGYTADGSQELEEHLVLAGYLQRLGDGAAPDAERVLRDRYARLSQLPSELLPHRVGRNAIAGLLPERTELLMVDTACSSSLYAIDIGMKALREGDADIAVCGGAFAYSARNLVLFSKLQGLSRSGVVRCFDRDADGVLFSDGAGAVVLKLLDRARADGDRVLGIVEGIGLSCDGRGKAIYAPNAVGQAFALRRAYHSARVDPADVCWVIAHATGTRAGDSTELASLHEVAGHGRPALLSSNKSVVGHTGWAAGLVSMSQALSGLARGEVPAQAYLRNPIPAAAQGRFTPSPRRAALSPAQPRRVGISSFGFGGTNAHLVLRQDGAEPEAAEANVVASDDIVVVGWAVDVPGGNDPVEWLCGRGPAPGRDFGDEYPLPDWHEVKLPPATLRNMDRGQVMVLRAAAALPPNVRAALTHLHDSTGVVVGHMGPTRRAVHYALRCYLGDLHRALTEHAGGPQAWFDRLTAKVHALVPASTEDAFPGIMPNIIPARLASAWDFHGLNLTVDTGPDSGLDAVRTAERYLRHGDLDVAVVAGVNGNSTGELRHVLGSGGEQGQLAEGAFLMVLARESIARAQSLPILGRVRSRVGPADPASTPRRQAPLAGCGRTYLGADPVVALLGHLVGAGGKATVGSTADWGTQIELTVPGTTASTVARAVRRLEPAPARRVRPALPAVPTNSLVLVSDRDVLAGTVLPQNVDIVVAPVTGGGALPEPGELSALLPSGDASFDHVRVLARLDAGTWAPDDMSAVARLRGLHDLAFLAAKRWRGGQASSFAVAMAGAVRAGVPHPASGPFTGLVKALAREMPSALAFAVLSDQTGTQAALDLLSAESARAQDLAVAVYDGGRRMEYQLAVDTAPAASAALPEPAVIVAAGGTRGLTAALLAGLAGDTVPAAIYLLGRNAPGDEILPPRAKFIAQLRHDNPEWTVLQLAAEYRRRAAAAAAAGTVRRLAERYGPDRVHFITCDLADHGKTMAAIDRIFAAHPRVDLLLNAAGIHSGGKVANTSLATLRAVRDTKLLAYLNLRAAFAGRRPGRWLNVGSLLAVLGWPGEADYCSGNDLLGVAAAWEARLGNGNETTLASPLWDESGFAAEPVVRELLRSRDALTAVSDQEGVALFGSELCRAEVEPDVTYLGTAEQLLLRRTRRHAVEVEPTTDDRGFAWRPHPELDGYLRDHHLFGVPTLPGAWIGELAVAASWREGRDVMPIALTGMAFHAPFAVAADRDNYCHLHVDDSGDGARVRLTGDIIAPGGRVLRRDRLHAEATVEFASERPAGAKVSVPSAAPSQAARSLYGSEGLVILAGPFAGLRNVQVGQAGTTAWFRPELAEWAERFAAFRLPVLLIDGLVQCALLAANDGARNGFMVVPTAVDRVDLFTGDNDAGLLARHGNGILITADLSGATAMTSDGTVLVRVLGVRAKGTAPARQEVDHARGR